MNFLGDITGDKFGQIDLLLTPQAGLSNVLYLWSDRNEPLSSQHFAVVAEPEGEVRASEPQKNKVQSHDCLTLRDPKVADKFRELFGNALFVPSGPDVEARSQQLSEAFKEVESAALPLLKGRRGKPWISAPTLELINQRRQARTDGQWESEKVLSREVKRSARKDRER